MFRLSSDLSSVELGISVFGIGIGIWYFENEILQYSGSVSVTDPGLV